MASVAERRRRLGRFAVRGVFWRQYLDWSMHNAPDYMRAWFMFFFTIFFFFFAAPARRAIMSNLSAIRPGSWRLVNYARTWKTLYNFAWTIADAAEYKITKSEFGYSLEGEPFLEALASADGAIVLTAHMGNYDLGAAIFAQRFNRQLRMVRAPEPDEQTARHLAASLRQTAEGAVKVSYNTEGTALSFELLYALRGGEIVSIQGDRVTHGVSSAEARLFGRAVQLPDGPFTLAFVTEKPIYPLFIVRAGFHRYKIIAHPPIHCRRSERSREVAVKATLDEWSSILETTIARYPSQWFSLVPTFRE